MLPPLFHLLLLISGIHPTLCLFLALDCKMPEHESQCCPVKVQLKVALSSFTQYSMLDSALGQT